jgi:4-amino-4-deoxy-L-arabinose transferase-like glycosyltransferase
MTPHEPCPPISDASAACRWKWALATVLLLALGLRGGAACGLQYLLDHHWQREFLIEGDADGYWRLAQQIATGGDYAVYTPPRYVLRMPGFPAVLAIPVWLFGPSLFAARLMLAGLGTFACWQVFALGRAVWNPQAGLIAAAYVAVSPVLVVFSVDILSETAFAVAMLWSLQCGQRLHQSLLKQHLVPREVMISAAWTGLAIAVGVYMRPGWLLAAPIVAALLLLTTPRPRRFATILAGGLILLTMLAALLPWGLRNRQVTGHFTFTTFWMGPSLYDGLNPHATGESDMQFYDQDNLMRYLSEYEVDQYYRQAAKDFVHDHPLRALQLMGNKAWRYWKPWPNAAQFDQLSSRVIVCLFFLPLLILAVWGACVVWKKAIAGSSEQENSGSPPTAARLNAIWTVVLLSGPIFYFAGLHLIFVSSLRYRLPAEYPFSILAAIGLLHVCRQKVLSSKQGPSRLQSDQPESV